MVEMVQQLHLPPLKPPEEHLCEKHEEKLRLFCEEDQTLICVVCDRSKEHRSHAVTPIEEAAQEYKVKLQDWLCPLRKEMGYILESKLREEEQCTTMRDKMRTAKQKLESEIEQLLQLLRDKDQSLHRKLEVLEKKITMVENANIAKLSNQITTLNALIADLEKKCKEPVLDLLKDVRSTLDRCKEVKFQGPEREMKKTKERGVIVVITLKPEEQMKKYKVMVTLDPDTAYPWLLLSEGGRHVRLTGTAQHLLDTPKRFTSSPCVLGREGFTSGRHYWEVQLLQEGEGWIVGVAAESVERKGRVRCSPEWGVWALVVRRGQFFAFTSPPTPLFPRQWPLKLGVYVDYDWGWLSLYNAASMELLYTFSWAPFTCRLFPFFCLEGELRLV
ncbi:E3 ubiquitin-protein ligase TRIM39-like [Pleurodeles waltl]|uniref:E3 ubiquitin-protein ligase TRIM39-like n=1 Tax=Pleurodeles waltl TaxID=8319 RepID=UPI0037096DB7